MSNIIILKVQRKHKDFIIKANRVINSVNETVQTNYLENNIEKDYFCDNPKFECLVAEYEGKPVGMILYSKFYWANDGEVLWISQMYVEKEYRNTGIFFELIKSLKNINKDIKIVSCATGEENIRMQKILKYYGCREINLKFYYKKYEI